MMVPIQPIRKRFGLALDATALAFFGAFAVAATWPLATSLATAIPGAGAGDNMQFLWSFWWMRQALASEAVPFFHSVYLFHPAGFDVALHTHAAGTAFLGATLFGSTALQAALNATILLSVTLNGFTAYLLGRRVAGGRLAAMTAGLYFAAAPFFPGHLLGHFNLVAAWTLPMLALCLVAFEGRGYVRALAVGVTLGLTAYLDYYFVAYGVLLVLVWGVWRLMTADVVRRRPSTSRGDWSAGTVVAAGIALQIVVSATGGWVFHVFGARVSLTSGTNLRVLIWIALILWLLRHWRLSIHMRRPAASVAGLLGPLACGLAAVAAVALPLAVQAARLWARGDYVAPRLLWRSAPDGVDLAAFMIGSPFHPIWGGAVTRLYERWSIDPIESAAWLGLIPMILVAVHWRAVVAQPAGRFWALAGGAFMLLSLGPRLHAFGFDTALMLPHVLFRFVPVLSNVRIPGRAIVMVYLAMSVLLALVLAHRGWGARRRLITVVAVALAIAADFWAAPIPMFALDRPAIYRELAALPAGAVCELPLGVRDGFGESGALDHRILYYQSLHGKPLVGGFAARLPSRVRHQYDEMPVLGSLLKLSEGKMPSGAELERDAAAGAPFLRAHGIRYFVLDTARASPELTRYVRDVLPVRLASASEGRELYVVDAR